MNVDNNTLNNYKYVETYAKRLNLFSCQKSLKLITDFFYNLSDVVSAEIHYAHSLSLAKTIIDLHYPFEGNDLDALISASLCHTILDFTSKDQFIEIMNRNSISPSVIDIIMIFNTKINSGKLLKEDFYSGLKKNKFSLILKIVDRADFLQKIPLMSIWQAKEYIYETRKYFFPLCIYLKEVYPEFTAATSILMEKIRNTLDASEIIISKFEKKENDLNAEILNLKEENAKIKAIIEQLENED